MVANDPFVDWTYDTSRISCLANEAFRTGRPDPWARIEAECLVDLIDAEMLALETRLRRGEPVAASIDRLKAMRTEAQLAITTLRAVEQEAGGSSASMLQDAA
jgi:hypothetical protein